jgi:hypothetical protein
MWIKHFETILNQGTRDPLPTKQNKNLDHSHLFIEHNVSEVINNLKDNKAAGLDGNEHIKATPLLIKVWTDMFNKCVKAGNIPQSWRQSTIKMLCKGKGPPENWDSFRGIALERNFFKIFTKLLTNRITELTKPLIPDNRFRLRECRSNVTCHQEPNE